MADDYCSIDLDTPTLTKEQIESAEQLANEIILENRAVDIASSRVTKPRNSGCASFLRRIAMSCGSSIFAISISRLRRDACAARPDKSDALRSARWKKFARDGVSNS